MSFTAGAVATVGWLVAAAANHQDRTFAARAFEFENRVQNPGQQLATIAAQIPAHGIIEMNLFQIRMHVGGSFGTVKGGHRRRVTKELDGLLGQLQPPHPEPHDADLRLRKRRKAPHAPATPTMTNTMMFSMPDSSLT